MRSRTMMARVVLIAMYVLMEYLEHMPSLDGILLSEAEGFQLDSFTLSLAANNMTS
jgi:hypothetical protein